MAKNNNKNQGRTSQRALPLQPKRKNQGRQSQSVSIRRSGPATLTAPTNLASSAKVQSEIIMQVKKGPNEIMIHPDSTQWLGDAAPSFQKWGMYDLTIWYEPRVATSTNGQIAMGVLSDLADRSPITLEETVALSGSQRGAPWSSFRMNKLPNRLFDFSYLRDFESADVTTLNDRSPGKIVVYADMDASFSNDDTIGWVYVSYKPVLHEPILRSLQRGNNTAPLPDGRTVFPADYLYTIQTFTNRQDFLGLNSLMIPDATWHITPTLCYGLNTAHGMNIAFNATNETRRYYLSVLLRDFSKFSSREAVKFADSKVHWDDGNKGRYTAFDNGDVYFHLCGNIEPQGWFAIDVSPLLSWSSVELFAFELDQEFQPLPAGAVIPAGYGDVAKATTPQNYSADSFSMFSETSTITYNTYPTYGTSLSLGATQGTVYSVDPQGMKDALIALTPDLTLCTGKNAYYGSLGFSGFPANQLGVGFKNIGSNTIWVAVTMIISNYQGGYGTKAMPCQVVNGQVMDTLLVPYGAQQMGVYNVRLDKGGAFTWTLDNVSTTTNGVTTQANMGNVLINVSSPNGFWSNVQPALITGTRDVATTSLV